MSGDGAVSVERGELVDALRGFPLFEAFSDEQLAWVVGQAEEVVVGAGAALFREGDAPAGFYVLLDGEVELLKRIGSRDSVTGSSDQPGVWAGAIPGVDDVYQITARATRPSRFLRVEDATMLHMVEAGFPIARHLMLGARAGTARFLAQVQQHEKLTSLGKMAAGLAHELNNPASAARRAASDLRAALQAHQEASLVLTANTERRELLEGLVAAIRRDGPPPVLSPLERSDREDEVVAWLERHRTPEPWELAGDLVDAGVDVAGLDDLARAVPGPDLATMLRWMVSGARADRLVDEIDHATSRISELVRAVKDYSYMDRAAVQEVDVHQGLESTLTILRHKLRRGIEVERDYAADLPTIWAHGSELNQVWTNLIDNAIDALGEHGHIRVATARRGDDVVVRITDDGPGIPPELQGRIFEPFFTTKEPGQGTGLGLDGCYRIVVLEHQGSITVDSRPGSTTFEVRLPSRPPAPQG